VAVVYSATDRGTGQSGLSCRGDVRVSGSGAGAVEERCTCVLFVCV
jgi:hypothetical protein